STEAGKIAEYLYDNAGNRFIKKSSNGTTLYLRHGETAVAMDIEMPKDDPTVKGKINRYVLSGELLAGRFTKVIKNDDTSSANVSYYHLDHLNSTKCVSNANGSVDVRYVYRAFGSQLAEIGNGDAKYTYSGKQLDDETSLYYFGARFYDSEIGRFINEDPAKDGLNWYVYGANNPLKFIDPNGLTVSQINLPGVGDTYFETQLISNLYGFIDQCKSEVGIDVSFNSVYRTVEYQTHLHDIYYSNGGCGPYTRANDAEMDSHALWSTNIVADPSVAPHSMGAAFDLNVNAILNSGNNSLEGLVNFNRVVAIAKEYGFSWQGWGDKVHFGYYDLNSLGYKSRADMIAQNSQSYLEGGEPYGTYEGAEPTLDYLGF
ncbi:MAG TPA: RHS repeat-associated core domain-containing protein, partial [Bacillota bacterium]|nr:RHS repeat-associated core domain-containing protein [Bacillota bacterium]